MPSIDEFPTLGERPSTPQNLSQRGAWSNDPIRGIHSSADFPALANVASNASNTNASQPRGIWRDQQPTASSTITTQNTTAKKVAQPVKAVTNGIGSMNMKEDFPALKGAINAKIPAPVSMFSNWSTAKKSAKQSSGKTKDQFFLLTLRLRLVFFL
jgi:hypothetical protein